VTLKQALVRAREILAAKHIEDAPLESELLLRYTLKLDRAQLYLDLDRELTSEEAKTYWQYIDRRCQGEPSAYITGHREFYGLDFEVDPRVLIPRPESELLVEKALRLAQTEQIDTIADIGTGCGAIVISLARNLPRCQLYATDISAAALEVARVNCRKHGVGDRVCVRQGDLLEPLPVAVDLVIANIPYVKQAEVPRAGRPTHEPELALDGGTDGLDKIRRLCHQVSAKLRPHGFLLLEIGQGQGKAVTALLGGLFPGARLEVTPDLGGIERMVCLSLTPALA
jgi:release factor glutamine methyltransferase